MLTRFDFSSDVAYDAYLLERGDRNAYVSVVLSLQEKNNELQAKMEKREEQLWNIVRSMDQAVSDLYDLL